MAMTLRLTDAETDALRLRAEREGRSMQEVAREPCATTSTAPAAVSCSTRSSTRSCRATPRRCGGSASDLPRPRGPAPHRAPDARGRARVRDHGLLESALARPQATAFGEDAYPAIHEKAAALLHSLARNHALVDGNKRLALAADRFLGINGLRLTLTNDEAYDFVIAVATGELDEVLAISSLLKQHLAPRQR